MTRYEEFLARWAEGISLILWVQAWTSSVFEASFSFEYGDAGLVDKKQNHSRTGDWQMQRKVKISKSIGWDDEERGDSCCFGTRSVEFGMDRIWKLHGGV